MRARLILFTVPAVPRPRSQPMLDRPPPHARDYYANITYQAGSWTKPRRVIAKVEWHPGELVPRVAFIVTNMSRPAERVVAFYNKRGTCEQWIVDAGVILPRSAV